MVAEDDGKSETFDPVEYWERRHVEFAGDYRNVGERGLSSEQNYQIVVTKALFIAFLLGKYGVGRGDTILDAGCGSGALTSLLGRIGFQMSGIDVSPTAISAARRGSLWPYEVAKLSVIPFDGQFTAVLCLDVFFHVIDDAEWKRAIVALFDALRPGGLLIIIEHFPPIGSKSEKHCRWRTGQDYSDFFNTVGAISLEDIRFEYPGRGEEKCLLVVRKP